MQRSALSPISINTFPSIGFLLTTDGKPSRSKSTSPRARSISAPARSRSNSPAINNDSILRSYQTREADFVLDDGVRRSAQHSPQLRAQPISDVQHFRSEISPIADTAPQYVADEKILHLQSSISDCGIIGTIRSVTYGTWAGKPACAVVLLFRFKWEETRFKSTKIEITFEKPSKAAPGRTPVVRNFSPRKVYGTKNTEERNWHYEVGLELGLPAGPASISPSGSLGSESSFTREHHLEIVGKPWMTKDAPEYNQVIWTATETRTQKHGIPDELNVAMVVEYDGPFRAIVDVEGKTSRNMTIRAWPWDKRSPLLFAPGTSFGKGPTALQFDRLSDREWRALAPYVKEYQDVVSMVSSHEDIAAAHLNIEAPPDEPKDSSSAQKLDDL